MTKFPSDPLANEAGDPCEDEAVGATERASEATGEHIGDETPQHCQGDLFGWLRSHASAFMELNNLEVWEEEVRRKRRDRENE